MRRNDSLTTFNCRLSRNLGAPTSWNPHGLSRNVHRLIYLYLIKCSFTKIISLSDLFLLPIVGVRRKRIIAARCRDLYLTIHNTHKGQTSMPLVRFELTNPASKQPQSYILDRVAIGIGKKNLQDKNTASFS